MNKIFLDDFMNNRLEARSAQLIIADPPYFKVKGDFDFQIDQFSDYLETVKKWATECERILATNGTLLWYGSARKISYTQVILDKLLDLVNCLVWDKGTFMGLEASEQIRSFAPCTERILVYGRDRQILIEATREARDYMRAELLRARGKISLRDINKYLGTAINGGGVASACLSTKKTEPGMITREMYQKLQEYAHPHMGKDYDELRSTYTKHRRTFNNLFNLQEVLRFSNESNTTGAKYEHDTVKPETLTRALILTCSNPGDLVVVPFAGSGTECAMAAYEGRRFVGYEINEKYYLQAVKRANKVIDSPKLFET